MSERSKNAELVMPATNANRRPVCFTASGAERAGHLRSRPTQPPPRRRFRVAGCTPPLACYSADLRSVAGRATDIISLDGPAKDALMRKFLVSNLKRRFDGSAGLIDDKARN